MIDNFSLLLFTICIGLTVFRATRIDRANTGDKKE